ncbi:MAG: hypothetical protein RLZZ139_770 [Cyanobacteriota bacterium]|jgi:hypothetical protein
MLFYYFYTIVSGRWQEVFMEELFRNLQDRIYEEPINRQTTLEAFYDLRNAYDKLPTNPTFKFAVGQEFWLLKNNKVQKGKVRVRQITESSEKLDSEKDYFRRNTPEKLLILYSPHQFNDVDGNWQLEESQLFASKQELLESL